MGAFTDGTPTVTRGEMDRLFHAYRLATVHEAREVAFLMACGIEEHTAVMTVRGDYVMSELAGRPVSPEQARQIQEAHTPKPNPSRDKLQQLRERAQSAKTIADLRAVVLEIIDLPSTKY